jgi:TonB family protein
MKRLTFIIALMILSAVALSAQTTENQNWTRLESDAKDFSVAVPTDFQVMTDEKGEEMFVGSMTNPRRVKLSDIRYITSFKSGASFLIESYKVNNLRDALVSLYQFTSGNPQVSEFNFEEFEGRMFLRQAEDSYSLEILAGYKNHIYRIYGGARDVNNEALKYFFSSLQLNGKKPFALKSALEGQVKETSAQLFGLTDTLFKIEIEEQKQTGVSKTEVADALPTLNPSEIKKTDNIKKMVILRRPPARYTEAARKASIKGTVRLRVTFSENGSIEKIVVLSGLPSGLTENAVKAARLIRFVPQETDNKPVTATKTVVYTFSIY